MRREEERKRDGAGRVKGRAELQVHPGVRRAEAPTGHCGPSERLLPWRRSDLYNPKKMRCPRFHKNRKENIYRISEKTEKLRDHKCKRYTPPSFTCQSGRMQHHQ